MEAHQQSDVMIMEIMKSHIKGKRTKRRRPSSTLSLTIASTGTSSTSTTTTTNETGTTSIEFTNILQENHINKDQYIANCLMLLAHGHQIVHSPTPLNMVVPSRSNVYKCKTCDRGFTSFQALGGHCASHNKPPKDVHELSKNRASFLIRTPNNPFSCNIPSGSIKGPKAHECSICGLDFTSGQALGGHMRRHRSMIMNTNTTTSTTATTCNTTTCNTLYGCHESKKRKILPPLDLNLPAPIEDDQKEIKTPFRSSNQIIVFSTPSLVDCHF